MGIGKFLTDTVLGAGEVSESGPSELEKLTDLVE